MTATISYSTTLNIVASKSANLAGPEFFADLLLVLPPMIGSQPKRTTEFTAEVARVINDAEDGDRTKAVDLIKAILAAIEKQSGKS